MAWRSSGSSNKELTDNLFRHGLITSPQVKSAMENVGATNGFYLAYLILLGVVPHRSSAQLPTYPT
jgi:hypothetical protein